MRPKRLFILAAGCLVIAAVLFAVGDTGPKWKGRSLSRWLALHRALANGELELADMDEPPEAIRQIGTNALPWLLARLRAQPRVVPPTIETILGKLPDAFACNRLVERWVRVPEQRASVALDGFQILGPRASPAIPELIKLYTQNGSHYADQALVFIGSDSVPALVQALSNPQQTNRWLLTSVLAAMRPHVGTNAAAVVQVLITCFQQPNSVLAKSAAFALGELRLEPGLAVPALLGRLEDPPVQVAVSTALMQFGPDAREAVPALINGLEHPGFSQLAAYTLGRLAIEPALSVPALTRCLQSTNGPLRHDAIEALGRFGCAARVVIPALLETLTNEPPTPSLDCRPEVANLLGWLRAEPRTVVPALIVSLQSSSQPLRYSAAAALGNFGPHAEIAVPELLDVLDTADESLHYVIVGTLRRIPF